MLSVSTNSTPKNITVERVAFDDFLREAGDMIRRHWNEVGSHRDVFEFNPDLDVYRALEKAGRLRLLVARDSGKMVGYFFGMIHHHPRSKTKSVARNDLIYVEPAYRSMFLGYRLLKEALALFEAEGVNLIRFGDKVERNYGRYLERLGFTKNEVIYDKVIWP